MLRLQVYNSAYSYNNHNNNSIVIVYIYIYIFIYLQLTKSFKHDIISLVVSNASGDDIIADDRTVSSKHINRTTK